MRQSRAISNGACMHKISSWYSYCCISSRFANDFCLTFDLENEQLHATLLSANKAVCGQGLEACLRNKINKQPCRPLSISGSASGHLYDKRCLKIDDFVRQLQFSDTGVSGGISLNATSLQAPIWLANIACVRLHPRAIFPFTQYWCLNIKLMCPTIDRLL